MSLKVFAENSIDRTTGLPNHNQLYMSFPHEYISFSIANTWSQRKLFFFQIRKMTRLQIDGRSFNLQSLEFRWQRVNEKPPVKQMVRVVFFISFVTLFCFGHKGLFVKLPLGVALKMSCKFWLSFQFWRSS